MKFQKFSRRGTLGINMIWKIAELFQFMKTKRLEELPVGMSMEE
jgi:hypothetical protein